MGEAKRPVRNPGGRPRLLGEYRDLARSYSAEALERLAQLMRSDDAAVALRACEAMLNRAWGTPTAEPERKGSAGATWRDGLTPGELERLRET